MTAAAAREGHGGDDAPRGSNGDLAPGGSLLCVANFPSDTGYAWEFIEGLFAGVADRLAPRGVRTWVAYPALPRPPRALRRSAALPVGLDAGLRDRRSLTAVLGFVRRHRVRVLYLTDRPAWHPAYPLLRLAGVRRIVVHDHTSGERAVPRGVRRFAKRLRVRIPGMLADTVIGVSDFVARRKVEVDLVPPGRVHRLWNSIPAPLPDPGARRRLRAVFGLHPERPVIVCACRAAAEKGVVHLLRAFEALQRSDGPAGGRPTLLYMGTGPALTELQAVRETLSCSEDVIFAGYRADARELLEGADVCVVPSVWQEAFGLAALEPMARGVPVVASRVGGIPEVVVDGETGILVPPGDEAGLARALDRLLADPAERARLGANGRRRAAEQFSLPDELDQLTELLVPGPGRIPVGPGPEWLEPAAC
jgi:glycosyltransferase involved in cell wall biosynthesis